MYLLIGTEIFMDISPNLGTFSCFEPLEAEHLLLMHSWGTGRLYKTVAAEMCLDL